MSIRRMVMAETNCRFQKFDPGLDSHSQEPAHSRKSLRALDELPPKTPHVVDPPSVAARRFLRINKSGETYIMASAALTCSSDVAWRPAFSSRKGRVMGDPFLNYFALFLLFFVVVVIFYGIIAI